MSRSGRSLCELTGELRCHRMYSVLDSRQLWGGRPLNRYNLRGWVAGSIGSECRMALFSYLLTYPAGGASSSYIRAWCDIEASGLGCEPCRISAALVLLN